MGRDRATFRKDLDDGDTPEVVREQATPTKQVPRCVRCGAEEPARRRLHFLCEACIDREHEDDPPGPVIEREPGETSVEYARRVMRGLGGVVERSILRAHGQRADRDIEAEKREIAKLDAARTDEVPF